MIFDMPEETGEVSISGLPLVLYMDMLCVAVIGVGLRIRP